MVVGESGLGKSTLINSLFLTDLYPERIIPGAAEKIERTVQIEASTVEIEERGVKLRLTVVDTPGYGDAINCRDCFKTIISYIDEQFERYLHDESGLNRRHIVDNRVHCCFYFISPFGHGLKPLDVEFMKAIHNKVNIVPVIAKADTLTLKERERLKKRILDEIEQHSIKIYHLPDAESDEDEDFKEQTRLLKVSIPFCVVGSNQLIEAKGKKVRGRFYPWGVVEVENPEHNDFLKLRTMLITHMQDLQEVTQDLHYENFRSERLKRGGRLYACFAHACNAMQRLEKCIGCHWMWCNECQELGVLVPQLKNTDHTIITPRARTMLERILKHAIRWQYVENLKRKPDQGKAFKVTCKWDASKHFLRGGSFT
ncbi:septin-2 isoform X2 [Mauremys reevesii]|nr:septin-2 isoform X2 [Mauremys reevesii]